MAAFRESYRRGNHTITGVVPIPLDDWDYAQIDKNMTCSGCRASGPFVPDYIYALILDGSQRAQDVLTRVRSTVSASWIPSIPPADTLTLGSARPERELLAHSFFLTNEDKVSATVRVLGLTHDGNKGLFEVYVNHGLLAEQWYHVVLVREANGWRFLSVSQVAIS